MTPRPLADAARAARSLVLALPLACGAMAQTPPETCRPDADGPIVRRDAFPAESSSPYILPFEPGTARAVWRTTGHHNPGNGQTGGPHLHFDVQRCGPNLPPRYNALPCGMTVPVAFRNAGPNACGVVAGRRVTAR